MDDDVFESGYGSPDPLHGTTGKIFRLSAEPRFYWVIRKPTERDEEQRADIVAKTPGVRRIRRARHDISILAGATNFPDLRTLWEIMIGDGDFVTAPASLTPRKTFLYLSAAPQELTMNLYEVVLEVAPHWKPEDPKP